MNKVTPGLSPSDWIEKTRAEAERIWAHVDRYPDVDDAAQSAVEALLTRLNAALDRAENGIDENTRLLAAFNAGAYSRELFIRFASSTIHAGQKSKRGGRDGGEERKQKARAQYANILSAFDDMKERHPAFTQSSCIANLIQIHGWSESTIKRALRSRKTK